MLLDVGDNYIFNDNDKNSEHVVLLVWPGSQMVQHFRYLHEEELFKFNIGQGGLLVERLLPGVLHELQVQILQ